MVDKSPQPPVSVTNVPRARSADVRSREVRYLVSMGIRTVCFVLAVVVSGWLRWVLVAAALFLPYVAVILANAAGRAQQAPAQEVGPQPRLEIETNDTPDQDPPRF